MDDVRFTDETGQYWVDLFFNEGETIFCGYDSNIPYEDNQAFLNLCFKNNIGYYARPAEFFSESEAHLIQNQQNYRYMILENLS